MSDPVSVRQRIVDHLQARFKDLRANTDGYTVTWNTVATNPVSKDEALLSDALSILDPRESKSLEIGYERCRLTVQTEFFYRVRLGDDPTKELRRLLLDVQRAMRSDKTCGGLSLNIVESGSELDSEATKDNLVSGIAFWEVLYRHKIDAPHLLVGE